MAMVHGKKPCEAGISISRRLEKGEGGLCHWHINNDMPGIKGEHNLIKCLLTDSLANREAAQTDTRCWNISQSSGECFL